MVLQVHRDEMRSKVGGVKDAPGHFRQGHTLRHRAAGRRGVFPNRSFCVIDIPPQDAMKAKSAFEVSAH